MRGFTLIEGIIALALITLSVVFLSTLAINYILILTSIKERFLALNFAQEGLELALALRNKQIENGISDNWLGVTTSGGYCLSFNTSTKRISVQSTTSPCEVIPGYKRLIIYQDFKNSKNTDLKNLNAVRVTSKVIFAKDEIKLDTVISKWHPTQR